MFTSKELRLEHSMKLLIAGPISHLSPIIQSFNYPETSARIQKTNPCKTVQRRPQDTTITEQWTSQENFNPHHFKILPLDQYI